MNKIEIIPAIDIIGGQCVRLSKGDYDTKIVYDSNPLNVAQTFEKAGIKQLHLVDLEGARSNNICNASVLKEISANTHLKLDFGGGLKSKAAIDLAFESGASQITLGSLAISDPKLVELCLDEYGADRTILGADVKNGWIATSGWEKDSGIELFNFLETHLKKGIRRVICTDISKDGMLQGPAIELYQSILKQFPEIQLIASGGVSCLEDVRALNEISCTGVIIGKAIYENRIKLEDLVNEFIR
ncbi:1-(5-phosphoribosyl)-5-[(5-phosphoribosylamino)methylideneamino]imidazole-4-carboxamide isomerase [Ancylomarina salipaludis]|uniref:1-(5-phosphoribosyl)-5-[(5-phosphoribosylamino)methylideneamino] imidazole-4-carboxamide isomerase n=1 Tax=Ancylomarina salipaludis TaxID=2501299 RepID=A0A4Q1JN44_9BACT|nr:1-(5-phosphoribosyl)-5-[(5-phosphoribosylamino)methylideneamino]imidazole-4-carboxamide isomerase [Ancylomarina salipaludis]RXQ95874.1 1-(5-phosphoribosyl)-5-[(5-phosphoribosylamino)methylideneamino]imidazole-4-carboxamide isomerase [Ancylomarina salipaludis]